MMLLCRDLCAKLGYIEDFMLHMQFVDSDPHEAPYFALRQELRRKHTRPGRLLYDLETPRGARERIEQFIITREDQEMLEYFTGSAWQTLDLDDGRVAKDFLFPDPEEGTGEEEALEFDSDEDQGGSELASTST
jgi:hypothetical protein